jgi:hypothetical protein
MRRGKHRARRALLQGLTLFVVAQVALAGAVWGNWGPRLRDPNCAHKVRLLQARLQPRPNSPRPLSVVQIGSSRTVYGVRGQAVEPRLAERLGRPVVLFNMGFHGAGPLSHRLNLERLFDAGVRPDLVLLEVLPATLEEKHLTQDVTASRLPACQLSYSQMQMLKRLAAAERPDLEREWWLSQVSPWFSHRFALVTTTAPTFLKVSSRMDQYTGADESGWVPLPRRPEATRRALAQAREEYHGLLQRFRPSPRALEVLGESVRRCREEGARAALVLMPEGPFFRSLYPSHVRRQIDEALARLNRRSGAALIDLRDAVAEEDFLDSHHLYPEGAALCTRRLAEQIEPLLRQCGGARSGESR